jgi:DNA-binding transcriptional MerR regulator
MKSFSISTLAREFGLSRSTLLYYDQIGLFSASGRTAAGYRVFTVEDRRRLETICRYRQTGLPLSEIKHLMSSPKSKAPIGAALRKRLSEIGAQILDLKKQQRLIAAMLKNADEQRGIVDKACWIEMLRAAGMDEAGMMRWHREFERRSPGDHHEFLASLGIEEAEIQSIRRWSSLA